MAQNLDPVLVCYAATLLMQLTPALVLDSRPIDIQVLQAIFPVLAELTVKKQSYGTLLALEIRHIRAPYSLGPLT